MLHAEIHGKLALDDSSALALERTEDVLTSSVFGTLLLTGADDLLLTWLGQATDLTGDRLEVSGPVQGYWFWPLLQGEGAAIEPDVLFRLGDALVIVEAKYRAGASNRSESDEHPERHRSQLAGQWRACRPSPERAQRYAPDLREVLAAEQRALVYLVRGKSTAKARQEMEQALEETPDARLFLLSWEQLHRLIDARVRSGDAPRWMRELELLLRRRSLVAFSGLTRRIGPQLRSRATALQSFRPLRTAGSRRLRFSDLVSSRPREPVRRLRAVVRKRLQSWSKEER